MMKFSYATNLAIATVLVVPAVGLQSGSARSLEESLSRTLAALENLAGIEQRIEARDPGAVQDVLRWTEAPLETGEDPGANDRVLDELREEVGQLQASVDLARQQQMVAAPEAPGDTLGLRPSGEAAPTTHGLDEEMLRRLAGGGSSVRSVEVKPTSARATRSKIAFEEEGYAADPLRLARAFYRASRYAEALEVLEPRRLEPDGRYWMARCLEKLGRSKEALDAFGEVIEMEDAGHLAERAKEDTDFLRWRMEFEKTERDGSNE